MADSSLQNATDPETYSTSLRWHCGADRLHVAFSELTETGSVECKNSLFNIKCLGKIIYHLFIYHSYTSNS